MLATVFVSAALAAPAVADPLVLRFAGQSPPEHMCTKTMENMAKEINEGTAGRIEVKVYPAGQLGNYTLVMEEMMRGTIDMACLSVATDFDPRLEILYANGYISDYAGAKKAFDPDSWLLKKLDEILSPLGVHLLGAYIEGFIGIASTKELIEPLNPKVDKGVLCRVPNMVSYTTGATAMGLRPITIPYPDVYQSMQTGVCDAADGYPTAAAYTILGDVVKYWYATNYSTEFLGMMVSDKTWQKISPEDQKVIRDVARKYTLLSIDNAENEDNKYMSLMEQKGVKVFKYTAEELKPIKEACMTSWDEIGKAGAGEDLIKEFKENLGNL